MDGWMDGWILLLFHSPLLFFIFLPLFLLSSHHSDRPFFFFRFFHSRPFPSSLRTGKPVGIRHSGDKNHQLSSKSTELNTFNFQVYGFSHPSAASQLQLKLLACVEEVSMWMRSNRLQLNPAKTEVLWLSSSRMQFNIPQSAFSVGNNVISSSPVVRDLGIYLDSGLTMTAHISKTVSNCFAALRQIRSVRRSLPTQITLRSTYI